MNCFLKKWVIAVLILSAILCVITLVGVLCEKPPVKQAQALPQHVTDAFNAANKDARSRDIVTTYTKLEPLTMASRYFEGDREGWVSMAMVKTEKSAQRFTKEPTACTPETEPQFWMMMPRQLENFCGSAGAHGDELSLRVAQWLGLYPTTNYKKVVLLRVRLADLFRPCADPETHDASCNATFPLNGSGTPISPHIQPPTSFIAPSSQGEQCPSDATGHGLGTKYSNKTYRDFYEDLYDKSYVLPSGLPWTRMGYTYDWNPISQKFGASEYIVKANAPYTVVDVLALDTFCNSSPRP